MINPSGPALRAGGMTVDGDVFARAGFWAVGRGEDGTVRRTDATIGGQLDCTDATMLKPTGPALFAERLKVGQDVHLGDGLVAVGHGTRGGLSCSGLTVEGRLDLGGATVAGGSGTAIRADGITVRHRLTWQAGLTARGGGDEGVVILDGSKIWPSAQD